VHLLQINDSLSWPTRLSRTRVSSVQGLSLSETPALASLNLDDVLRTVQRLGLKRCLYSDIENLKQVGEGETFRVDKCIYNKQTVAVKHIKLGANQKDNHGLDRRLRAILSEIRIMYHAPLREHPNVLFILGYGWRQSGQAPMPYIVVEYAMFGSLRQYLAESERNLRTKIIMAGDIAAGLNALHQCDIVHGDLKLDNVVVLQSWDRPSGAIAKLCDFGHAIVLSGDKRHQKYFGTALYVFSKFILRQ
jgi:serine/threonine protein kinase